LEYEDKFLIKNEDAWQYFLNNYSDFIENMKKINTLFQEKGEKRLVGLTKRTYRQEAAMIMNDDIFGSRSKRKKC